MKRGKNYEKARIKVAKQHNHIAFKRTDYQFKLAHKLCDMADTIYVEDCDFRIMAKGMFRKHSSSPRNKVNVFNKQHSCAITKVMC